MLGSPGEGPRLRFPGRRLPLPQPLPSSSPHPYPDPPVGEGVPLAPPVRPLGPQEGPPGPRHPDAGLASPADLVPAPLAWPAWPTAGSGRDVWPRLCWTKPSPAWYRQLASPLGSAPPACGSLSFFHPRAAGFIPFLHLSQASRGSRPRSVCSMSFHHPSAWGGRPQGHANGSGDSQQGAQLSRGRMEESEFRVQRRKTQLGCGSWKTVCLAFRSTFR